MCSRAIQNNNASFNLNFAGFWMTTSSTNRAWGLGEEKDKELQKFPLNRGDNKPRRCEQHF